MALFGRAWAALVCFAIAAATVWFSSYAGWLLKFEEVLFSGNQLRAYPDMEHGDPFGHPPWLPSCKEIYLDMGSNRGVQIRKLFEPAKYPEALSKELFEQHYGKPMSPSRPPSSSTGLCALGFEPNPNHHLRLSRLQRAYEARGWNVHFYPYACWIKEASVMFSHRRWKSLYALTEGDAGIGTNFSGFESPVRAVDMAKFIRSLPARSIRLWKMDIEGAECAVLPYLFDEGLLCRGTVDAIALEYHSTFKQAEEPEWQRLGHLQGFRDKLRDDRRCVNGSTLLLDVDDESYDNDVDADFVGLGAWSWRPVAILALGACAYCLRRLWDFRKRHVK